MYNINIIFTRHHSLGRCNQEELYNILSQLQPEVIFEELCSRNFMKSYEENKLITLETNAIKLYRLTSPIKQVPVDTFVRPIDYDNDSDNLLNILTQNNDLAECRSFCELIDSHVRQTAQYGFPYLNSTPNDEFFKSYNQLKKTILNLLNDNRLNQIDKMTEEVNGKREDEMLENIYRYSRNNQYKQGLFFIGSGHRQSILQKIKKNFENKEPKINWFFYE